MTDKQCYAIIEAIRTLERRQHDLAEAVKLMSDTMDPEGDHKRKMSVVAIHSYHWQGKWIDKRRTIRQG